MSEVLDSNEREHVLAQVRARVRATSLLCRRRFGCGVADSDAVEAVRSLLKRVSESTSSSPPTVQVTWWPVAQRFVMYVAGTVSFLIDPSALANDDDDVDHDDNDHNDSGKRREGRLFRITSGVKFAHRKDATHRALVDGTLADVELVWDAAETPGGPAVPRILITDLHTVFGHDLSLARPLAERLTAARVELIDPRKAALATSRPNAGHPEPSVRLKVLFAPAATAKLLSMPLPHARLGVEIAAPDARVDRIVLDVNATRAVLAAGLLG
jgi:hypothetical protein